MITAWQIELKPCEGPAEENGRWLARKVIDGHIVGITRRSYPTEEAAIAAFNAPDYGDETVKPKEYP